MEGGEEGGGGGGGNLIESSFLINVSRAYFAAPQIAAAIT